MNSKKICGKHVNIASKNYQTLGSHDHNLAGGAQTAFGWHQPASRLATSCSLFFLEDKRDVQLMIAKRALCNKFIMYMCSMVINVQMIAKLAGELFACCTLCDDRK